MIKNSKSHMSRSERLARQLLKYYGYQVLTCDKFSNALPIADHLTKILVKPDCKSISWYEMHFPFSQVLKFRSWEEILFGSRKSHTLPLNGRIEFVSQFDGYRATRNRSKRLLDFKTLDELDLQLTLAGANSAV